MQPLVGFEVHLSLGIAYLQKGWVDRAMREMAIAKSLAKDKSTLARRFPSFALEIGRDQLSLWANNDKTQEILDRMIPLAWGICRPEDFF
jgi:hypothetical protein